MIKFVFFIIGLNIILIKNKIIIFYYNLLYLFRFLILFVYINKDLIWRNISFRFARDYYSILLIILRFWVIALIMICLNECNIKIFIFINLLIVLIFFFISLDLILFYFIFEVRLIPTFFLIVYWGSNLERVRAAYYIIIYILLISFPLLVYIIKIYYYRYTIKFRLIFIYLRIVDLSLLGYLIIYISFFIKIPIYLFHIWLPKAHVEAPVYGSIILAGVLLKIGRYGLLRLLELFIYINLKYNYLIFSVGIIGRVLVGLVCLTQIDIKRLVAYSSVVHINIILCAIITLYKLGFLGRYIIIISHGLCSSGLFYIVNLYYYRTGSRLLLFNKGIIIKIPSFAIWWFLLCAANFSYPFSINFFSELIILRVLISWDVLIIIYLILICFFRGAYSLYLFSYVQHGGKRYLIYTFNDLRLIKDLITLILHFFPLVLFLLNIVLFS